MSSRNADRHPTRTRVTWRLEHEWRQWVRELEDQSAYELVAAWAFEYASHAW